MTVLAYNAKAADELRERCVDIMTPQGPEIRTLNSIGLSICNQSDDRGRLKVLDEAGARDLVGSVFEIRHRANTDTVVPYLEALSAIRLGLLDPDQAEETYPDAAGVADGVRALPERGSSPPRPSTSTSRSTGRSRSCWTDPGHPGQKLRSAVATCWSTSSRTSRRRICCSSGC